MLEELSLTFYSCQIVLHSADLLMCCLANKFDLIWHQLAITVIWQILIIMLWTKIRLSDMSFTITSLHIWNMLPALLHLADNYTHCKRLSKYICFIVFRHNVQILLLAYFNKWNFTPLINYHSVSTCGYLCW